MGEKVVLGKLGITGGQPARIETRAEDLGRRSQGFQVISGRMGGICGGRWLVVPRNISIYLTTAHHLVVYWTWTHRRG